MSMCYTVSWEQNALEYISNTKSDGLVFVSPLCTEYAVKRYNIPENKYLILENYIIEHMKPQIYYERLSKTDGGIHAVYTGKSWKRGNPTGTWKITGSDWQITGFIFISIQDVM